MYSITESLYPCYTWTWTKFSEHDMKQIAYNMLAQNLQVAHYTEKMLGEHTCECVYYHNTQQARTNKLSIFYDAVFRMMKPSCLKVKWTRSKIHINQSRIRNNLDFKIMYKHNVHKIPAKKVKSTVSSHACNLNSRCMIQKLLVRLKTE